MSEYERKVQQNIEDRKKMFDMLRLGEAKEKFAEIVNPKKVETSKASQRGFKRKAKEEYSQ